MIGGKLEINFCKVRIELGSSKCPLSVGAHRILSSQK